MESFLAYVHIGTARKYRRNVRESPEKVVEISQEVYARILWEQPSEYCRNALETLQEQRGNVTGTS